MAYYVSGHGRDLSIGLWGGPYETRAEADESARVGIVQGRALAVWGDVTDEEIEALRVEAEVARDAEMLGTCRAALLGDPNARRVVWYAIDAAAAMDQDEDE